MTKKCLFAVALLSVALWTGCAKGLGSTPTVTVDTNPPNQSVVAVSLTVNFVATVKGTSNTAVNWSVSGGNSCTGSACGSITSAGVYTAPTTLPSGKNSLPVTITAISQADPGGKGQAQLTVLPITVKVAPTPVSVGQGLVQQFTAVAVPDNVTQTFTWTLSCTQTGAACGTLAQDSTTSGLAVYTAPSSPPTGCTPSNCVVVTATSTVNPGSPSSGPAKVLVVSSRITGTPTLETYAFRFSGYDAATHAPVEKAGSVVFRPNGTVAAGAEDVVINAGPGSVPHQYVIASGSYTASTAADNNTNNAGTLTLSASGGPTDTYRAVLDSVGNMRLIESDGNGTGSGSMEKQTAFGQFNNAPQTFVFGFTGTDSSGHRAGYVGLLPMDGTATTTTPGHISGGLLDANDNGTNVCGTQPCNVGSTSTYYADATIPGLWHMTLNSVTKQDFDFFIGPGQANAKNPLTLYAISTDPIDGSHPALSGRMVFQDPATTYDKAALNNSAVAHLTGVDSTGSNTLVSLSVVSGDGNGNISGTFDANNAGTIVAAQNFTCTYTTGTGGRYVITLLGNSSTCGGTPLPFVFYASGANRGLLLDQSSAAVMTGAMDPQGMNLNGTFAPSSLPGTYAAATVSNATSSVVPMAANLLLTSLGPPNFNYDVAGTLYPGGTLASGSYSIMLTGNGTITLTFPAVNYVIYATDNSHFEMIDVDSSVKNASVMFAQQ